MQLTKVFVLYTTLIVCNIFKIVIKERFDCVSPRLRFLVDYVSSVVERSKVDQLVLNRLLSMMELLEQ